MQRVTSYSLRSSRQRTGRQERGVALLTTLLLLMLMTGLSLAMVMSVRSDLLVNGYYRNFRGSFYAADSGLNVARQDFFNEINKVVGTWNGAANTQPIPTGTEGNVLSTINTRYATSFPVAIAGSWPESFHLDTTQTQFNFQSCTPSNGGNCGAPTGNPTSFKYVYTYQLAAIGSAQNQETSTITDRGQLTVNVAVTSTGGAGAPYKTSFAAWGTFIDKYAICSAAFVPGTLTGPFFTNDSWNFGDTGPYTFTDSVGSVNQDAGFMYSGGGCDQVNGSQDTKGKTTIKPNFESGFNRGQNKVPLPTDSFSQERAVIDGQGTNTAQPTQTELSQSLKDSTGKAYPSSGSVPNNVFLPYATTDSKGNKLTPPVFTGGGILVQGSASVKLSPGSKPGSEVYQITQGSTTTTITIDPSTNTTTMNNGSGNVVISGVPEMRDSSGNPVSPATMLYVNGAINSISGPGEGANNPAINDGVALTVTATGNVTITGDIRYKTEPVTTTDTIDPKTGQVTVPADSLISGNDTGQVLGIFTATGDVIMNDSQSDHNLWIDASIAMISNGGSGGWTGTQSNPMNTVTLLGGRIANAAKPGYTTTRNLYFDKRFLNGFAPPWYPSTTVTPAAPATPPTNTGTATPTFTRTLWVFKGSTY